MAEIKKISTELQLLDKFLDTSGDAGTSGQVLTSTGTGINWVSGGSLPGGPYLPLAGGTMTGNVIFPGEEANSFKIAFTGASASSGISTVDQSGSGLFIGANSRVNTSGVVITNDTLLPSSGIYFDGWSGDDIEFYTGSSGNPTKRLTIKAGGDAIFTENVGIGTTSPAEELTVAGTIMVISGGGAWGTSSGGVQLNYNSFTSQGHLTTYYDSTSLVLGAGVSQKTGITINGQSNAGGNNILFRVGNSERMRIISNGNVGIGATSPGERLEVVGNILFNNSGEAWIKGYDDYHSIKFRAGGANKTEYYEYGGTLAAGLGHKFFTGGTTGQTLKFQVADDGAYFSGNVGIGNSNPGDYATEANNLVVGSLSGNNGITILSTASSGFGSIYFADGTVGNKVYSGFIRYQQNISDMTFGTNEVERMRLTLEGYLGIGTTNPSQTLEVHSTIKIGETGVTGGRLISGDSMIFQIDSDNSSNGSSYRFRANGTADNGTELMRIQENGNVGIGVTNPGRKLSIAGSIELTGSDMVLNTTSAAIRRGSSGQMFLDAPGDVTVTIDSNNNNTDRVFNVKKDTSTELFRVQENGNVGIGTTSPGYKLSVNGDIQIPQNEYIYFDNTAHYIRRGPSDVELQGFNGLNLLTNGSSRLYINQTGNVGIGTTSPSAKLEVNVTDDTFNDINVLKLKRIWSTASGNDRAHGISFNDANSTNATIYADRTSSASNYNSDLLFDTNTGTSGTSVSTKMIIKAGGNVGIGTTSPNAKLQVGGDLHVHDEDGNTDARVMLSSGTLNVTTVKIASNGSSFFNAGNIGIGTTSPGYKLDVNGQVRIQSTNYEMLYLHQADANGGFIKFTNTDDTSGWYTGIAGTEKFIISRTADNSVPMITVEQNGNVGIGTTSPDAPLYIKGNSDVAAQYLTIEDADETVGSQRPHILFKGNGSDLGKIRVEDNGVGFRFLNSNDSIKFSITDGGNVGIGTTSPGSKLEVAGEIRVADGTKAAPSYTFTSDTNTGMYSDAADTIKFTVGGNDTLTINSSNNVGIGTSAPDVKFHVTKNEDGSGLDKGTAKFINTNTGQGATTMHMVQTSSSNFANAVKFWQGSTPTPVGFIRLTTTATQFITSASDLNLKKNITNWSDDTLSKFKALQPKKFRFNAQDVSEDKTLGFIAQNEVNNFPEAYPQFLGDDENPYYGFNPSGMVPHLMKAIKDLVEKVETLENKITQLENNN